MLSLRSLILAKLCARGVAFPLCESAVLPRDGFTDHLLPGQTLHLRRYSAEHAPFLPDTGPHTRLGRGSGGFSHPTSSPPLASRIPPVADRPIPHRQRPDPVMAVSAGAAG